MWPTALPSPVLSKNEEPPPYGSRDILFLSCLSLIISSTSAAVLSVYSTTLLPAQQVRDPFSSDNAHIGAPLLCWGLFQAATLHLHKVKQWEGLVATGTW